MIFPYSTDAPIYHWPYGTVGLIVANCMLFFAFGPVDGVIEGPWLLEYGSGLNPLQWFCSPFMHAGIFHLIINMLFLWVFGLVVEGKLGVTKFLASYFGIAVLQSALEQVVMMGYSGMYPGSLGASSAIYGLMAMAGVWAPANNISTIFMFRGLLEIPIGLFAVFFIGQDFFFAMLLGGWAASSILHLMGAALGFPLAVWMLKAKIVDCEGWDMFARANLRRPGQAKEEAEQREREEEQQRKADEQKQEHLVMAREKFHEFLDAGNPEAAYKLHAKMKGNGLILDPAERASLIKGLHTQGKWAESAPFLAEIIKESPDRADPIRLKLAQICVLHLERPARAVELLAEVKKEALNEKQMVLAQKLHAKARSMRAGGHVELDDAAW